MFYVHSQFPGWLDEQLLLDQPTEDVTPFTVGVINLEETGRLLAWFGKTIAEKDIRIGMPVQVVPRMFEETEDIKVYYTLERPGTTWVRSDSA